MKTINKTDLSNVLSSHVNNERVHDPMVILEVGDNNHTVEDELMKLFPGSMYNTGSRLFEGGLYHWLSINDPSKPHYIRYTPGVTEIEEAIEDGLKYINKSPVIIIISVTYINPETVSRIEKYNLEVYVVEQI